MGIGISGWRLARTVSMAGQLGVVSGTAVDALMARTLEDGDSGGHYRRALAAFPVDGVAEKILKTFYRSQGRQPHAPYRSLKMMQVPLSREREELIMAATFAEVWLAKEGHDRPVGINLLTKVQLPTLPSLYGAMLANVDVVIMGAGIPREIPGVLDAFARHDAASIRHDVEGAAPDAEFTLDFDPNTYTSHMTHVPTLQRPIFLAIVSSTSLATMLQRRSTGVVNGFIVEAPTAGGHNAPPRGEMKLSEGGEPVYGDRDVVDPASMKALGLPFWLAGGTGHRGALAAAQAAGATGIQIGTLMAFADESGVDATLRQRVIDSANDHTLRVFTDPKASPTGYPFKIVHVDGAPTPLRPRTRRCDLGYLRTSYALPDGRIAFRCSAEPVATYVAKGGVEADTEGRRCLCNALLATTGHGQVRKDGTIEQPIVTAGDQAEHLAEFLEGRKRYGAEEVLEYVV